MEIRPAITAPVAPEARIGIIFFGCLLGIALYLVQRNVGNDLDYIVYEIWIVPVLGFFGLLMFLITDLRDWRPWLATLGYGALVFALTLYVSAQCGLPAESRCSVIGFPGFLPSQFIAWFILLFFLQSRFDPAQPGWTYGAFLHNSWHNFLTSSAGSCGAGISETSPSLSAVASCSGISRSYPRASESRQALKFCCGAKSVPAARIAFPELTFACCWKPTSLQRCSRSSCCSSFIPSIPA